MRFTLALVVLSAVACAEPPVHEKIRGDPRYPALYPQARSEPEIEEFFAMLDAKEASAGLWGVPMSDPLGGLVFLASRAAKGENVLAVPPSMTRRRAPPAALPGALPPSADPYALLRDLDGAIGRDPYNPEGYELRANVFDALGWAARADRDRRSAKLLRMRVGE